MKKAAIVLAAIFFTAAAFAQPDFTVSSDRTPGNLLATQNAPGTRIVLMQNPARGMLNFQVSNPANTTYEISLYSARGQKITSVLYQHPAGTSLKTMYVPIGVKGIYYLIVRNESERLSTKVLVE